VQPGCATDAVAAEADPQVRQVAQALQAAVHGAVVAASGSREQEVDMSLPGLPDYCLSKFIEPDIRVFAA